MAIIITESQYVIKNRRFLENKAGLLKNTPRVFPITPKVNLMEDGRKILGKKTC